jgi:hypothetical protein
VSVARSGCSSGIQPRLDDDLGLDRVGDEADVVGAVVELPDLSTAGIETGARPTNEESDIIVGHVASEGSSAGSEEKGRAMLERVITGGQTGADQAGWQAAQRAGIATGGWMPLGFRTEGRPDADQNLGPDESHPEFELRYGARAHESLEYRVRTRENLRGADAVVWFGDPLTRDGRLTLGLARLLGKPAFIVDPGEEGRPTELPERLADWLQDEAVHTLLVAGNRESRAQCIGACVEAYLIEVFQRLPPIGLVSLQ